MPAKAKRLTSLVFCTIAALGAATASAESGASWDSLVEIKSRKLDQVYVLPGASFSGYRKLMLDPAEVAFRKDWLSNMQRNRDLARNIDDEDAARIAGTVRDGVNEVFSEAYAKAGYELVTAPGPDVLRLSPAIIDLYVNAPDVNTPGRSRTYVMSAGEATLVLEVRDSVTNTLLGRAVDRRETRETGSMMWSSSVSNRADFAALFRQWANITVQGFESLAELGSIPEDLQAWQKL